MKISVLVLTLLLSNQLLALELKGSSDFSRIYALNSAVSGIVSKVLVQPGHRVKRGDLLIKLDPTPFLSAVAIAEANLKARAPSKSEMLTELEKAQELYDRDSLALVELQQAENNLQIADSQFAAAGAALQLAEFELKKTMIRAPDDLLVLKVATHEQYFVNTRVSNQALVTLVNNQQMVAVAYLAPDQWNPDLVGKSVKIDYLGNIYRGKVVSLDYQRKTGNASAGFELRVLFGASGKIPANMPVTIDIQE